MFEVTFSVKRYFGMKGKGGSGVCGGIARCTHVKGRRFLLKPQIKSVILILQQMDAGYLHQCSGWLWAGRPVFDFRQMHKFSFVIVQVSS
jgi:hypothetical protein